MRRADNLTTFMCWMSWNLGRSTSWNPQGFSRSVMGLLYLYLPVDTVIRFSSYSHCLNYAQWRWSAVLLRIVHKVSEFSIPFDVGWIWASSAGQSQGFTHTLKYPVIIFVHMIQESCHSTLHKGVFSCIVFECYCFVNGIKIQAYRLVSVDILHIFRDSCTATNSTQSLYILPVLVSFHYNAKRKSLLLRSPVMVSTDNASAYEIL